MLVTYSSCIIRIKFRWCSVLYPGWFCTIWPPPETFCNSDPHRRNWTCIESRAKHRHRLSCWQQLWCRQCSIGVFFLAVRMRAVPARDSSETFRCMLKTTSIELYGNSLKIINCTPASCDKFDSKTCPKIFFRPNELFLLHAISYRRKSSLKTHEIRGSIVPGLYLNLTSSNFPQSNTNIITN